MSPLVMLRVYLMTLPLHTHVCVFFPTGFPVRVHKKRATVRYMFHHPDDVRWFRPVELSTRSGRRGRITEALGAPAV